MTLAVWVMNWVTTAAFSPRKTRATAKISVKKIICMISWLAMAEMMLVGIMFSRKAPKSGVVS